VPLAPAFAAFACLGLWVTALGPSLREFATELDVSLSATGLLLSALFAGSITGSASVATVLRRRDPARVSLAGLLLIASGLALLPFAGSLGFAAAVAGYIGLGDGLVVGAGHNLVARASANIGRDLNRLNLYFAIGAIAGPAWAGVALTMGGGLALVFVPIAVIALAAAMWMAVRMLGSARGATPRPGANEGTGMAPPPVQPGFLRDPRALAMGAILFLYVGAEFGLGSWIATFIVEGRGNDTVLAGALVSSGYWLALFLGRLAGVVIFDRGIGAPVLLMTLLGCAVLTSGLLALSQGSLWLGAPAAFLTGLCFGPVWPTAIAVAEKSARAGGAAALVTIGNAGGIALPWLQGRVLADAGPTRGILVTGVLCILMLVVLAIATKPFTRPLRRAAVPSD
jgi:fucose permease